MKKPLLIFALIIVFNTVYAQVPFLTYKPRPAQTVNKYEFTPPPTTMDGSNYNANEVKSNTKSIDFNNTTLNFFKVRLMIIQEGKTITDETSNANNKFIVRTNYIIDEENNVWDIKGQKYDSEFDGIDFYCTRNNQYSTNFLIKMDGSAFVQYSVDENKKVVTYVSF